MNKIDLISIPAYEFFAPEELTSDAYHHAVNHSFRINVTNQSSNEIFYHERLIKWFNQCLAEVKSLYFSDNLELVVSTCWVNKSAKFQYHHLHFHPNSIVSGLFYLDNNNAGTEYQIDDPWLKFHNEGLLGIGKKTFENDYVTTLNSVVKPQSGKLIIWPSTIKHKTEVNKEIVPRYTISFNAFVTGRLNPVQTTTILDLVSTPVEKLVDSAKS